MWPDFSDADRCHQKPYLVNMGRGLFCGIDETVKSTKSALVMRSKPIHRISRHLRVKTLYHNLRTSEPQNSVGLDARCEERNGSK
jgi:hypothetical protein